MSSSSNNVGGSGGGGGKGGHHHNNNHQQHNQHHHHQNQSEISDIIKDFVFDLHDATRRSYRLDDVQQLYDIKFKEITDKYLSHSMWPTVDGIANECDNDQTFLLFYRELSLRHFFAKQKHIQIAPYFESWNTYNKLFDVLITTPNSFIAITPQWAYDIVQEFVYQFQSFSQFRSHHHDTNSDEGRQLEANQTAWSLPAVTFLLSRAIRLTSNYPPSGSIHYLIGYFAKIELSRVECLICDYSTSYRTAASVLSLKPAQSLPPSNSTGSATSVTPELYTTVFPSHLNLYYHTGISLFMLRRYNEVIELYTSIALHIARLLKPGGGANSGSGGNSGGGNNSTKNSPYNQFQKVGDKILSLTALAAALSPNTPLDNHVADLIATKLGDKLRRLKAGELSSYREIFESAVPKFVSPIIASSTTVTSNDIRHTQIDLFLNDVKQQLDLTTTRRYLRLYTTVPIQKLSQFTEVNESQMTSRLFSLARKNQQESSTNNSLKFSIHGSDLVIENGRHGGVGTAGTGAASCLEVERYFMNGIRKNIDLLNETEKIFRKLE